MRRKIVLLSFVFILSAAVCFSQEYTVEYVEGYADGRIGGKWMELYIGDVLGSGDLIRLEEDSLVELSSGGASLTVTKAGTFNVNELYKQSKSRENMKFGSLIGNKLGTMFGESGSDVPTAVGGVRGDAVGGDDGFGWVESEVEELIDTGIAALGAKEYERALGLFQEAYDYSIDAEEENKSLYYIGYTYSLMGQPRKALSSLGDIDAVPASDIYADYYLLRGKILIETFDYESAVVFLTGFEGDAALKEERQAVFFLIGVAYDALGNKDQASKYFKLAWETDADSEIGKTAYHLING